jgi:flotillin
MNLSILQSEIEFDGITMGLVAVVAAVLFIVIIISTFIRRYKRCPANKILVIYGRGNDTGKSARCISGGAAFIWPVFQDYAFLDLAPLSLEVELKECSFSSEYTRRRAFKFYHCDFK